MATSLLGLVCGLALGASAAEEATGTIKGRVLDQSNGRYLSKAVVEIEGTNRQVLTNDYGEYELRNIPAGLVQMTVAFGGGTPKIVPVTIEAGKTVMQDVGLNEEKMVLENGTVVLDRYVVSQQRFRTGEEVAINEQRQSSAIKDVVTADSQGYVADGNIGEFVRFLPGVEVEYGDDYSNASDASGISVRGFGAENTAIMVDGMPVSSASPGSLSRAIGLDMLSINNASRIEVQKVPTPDMPAESAGGSINLVTRSAFEYAKPSYTLDVSASMSSMDTVIFKKQPGPSNKKSYHTLPNVRFSASVPLSSKLGFSVSLASDNKYSPGESASSAWQSTTTTLDRWVVVGGTSTQRVTITDAKGKASDLANPYVSSSSFASNPWNTFKRSGNLRLDWRPFTGLVVKTNGQYSEYNSYNVSRVIRFSALKPQDWGEDYTYGTSNTVSRSKAGNAVEQTIDSRDKSGNTFTGYLTLDYSKGPWTMSAKFNHSLSRGRYDDLENGHFSNMDAKLSEVDRVNLLGIDNGIAHAVEAYAQNGSIIDYTKLSNWSINNATQVKSGESFSRDLKDTINVDVRRDLDFLPFSMSLKGGWSRNIKSQAKWGRGTGYTMQYIGPAMSVDDMVSEYAESPGFGLAPQQWADTYRMYDLYKAHPEWFSDTVTTSLRCSNYNSQLSQSKNIKEVADAWYGMIDGKLFGSRLGYWGGYRRKYRNTVDGMQNLVNSKYNYLQYENGTLYKNDTYINGILIDGATNSVVINGQNVKYTAAQVWADTDLAKKLATAGLSLPTTPYYADDGTKGTTGTNLALAQRRSRLANIHKSRTELGVPSVGVSYKVLESVDVKLSWSQEQTLPNLEGSSSTAGILSGTNNMTISEALLPDGSIGSDGTIKMQNPLLKPKTTTSYNLQIGYYPAQGCQFRWSGYYKKTENLWESEEFFSTDAEYNDLLDSLGLDRDYYENWMVVTQTNGDAVATSRGMEADVKFALGALGAWGNPYQVFVTYSHKPQSASKISSSTRGVVPLKPLDAYSAGISASYRRFSMQLRATYKASYNKKKSTIKYDANDGQGVLTYQLYTMNDPEYRVNLQTNYKLTNSMSVFFTAQDLIRSDVSSIVYDKGTGILPDYAKNSRQRAKSINMVFGVQSAF